MVHEFSDKFLVVPMVVSLREACQIADVSHGLTTAGGRECQLRVVLINFNQCPLQLHLGLLDTIL